ncbi:hypothetical protein Q4503_01020 [Colwellia sp. 6_MG-2023]|uniref:hypothetical protein n=1 Tax=Colwellia sp. 6_MG-2023 TaxID=3062676 RepID=UPI0026E45E53|nr:hypothetical protein [Colwellia sp. 6_MG-2023]MDO6486260.1 hypothetical protein [Colwellia sp. 6_MG-2023]
MSEYDDYIDIFLDESSIKEDGAICSTKDAVAFYPDWVSAGNVSVHAYNEIENLKKVRMRSIAISKSKSDLNKKSNYQISKAEVARAIGVKPQPLFHSDTTTYSEKLLIFINDVNLELVEKRELKLNRSKNGISSRTKEDIVSGFKKQNKTLIEQKESMIDELYKKFKAELSFDVKAKLKIR